MSVLSNLYSDKNTVTVINKVLCILEGKSELNLIKKIYELYSSEIMCDDFIKYKIKLSWGKVPIQWINKDNCNFQGGNITGCAVPQPVIESLNNENISSYKAVVVMFDKDCDIDNAVFIESNQILENYKNSFIFVSNPCFEKVGIDFILTDEIKEYLDINYHVIGNSKCRWYKNNYSNLPTTNLTGLKAKFINIDNADELIKLLEVSDIEDGLVELSSCIHFVKCNF